MRQLLLGSAILAAMGIGAAQAQDAPAQPAPAPAPAPAMPENAATPAAPAATITAPEGYVASDAVLTSDKLEGAKVYDASGADIGEVHGLVFADGSTSLDGAAPATGEATTRAAPATTGMGATTTGMAPDTAASDTAAAPAAGATGSDTTGSETTGMAGTQNSGADADNDSSNVASGTATGDNDRIENVGSDSSTVTPTDATTPPLQETTAATPAATTATTSAGGMATNISHAIIDVGGFLGMGEHRVAVPVKDLVAYTKDDDLRVYLPWTREQLEALPEFDADGPAPVSQ